MRLLEAEGISILQQCDQFCMNYQEKSQYFQADPNMHCQVNKLCVQIETEHIWLSLKSSLISK